MSLSRRALLVALGAAPLGARAAEMARIVCALVTEPKLLIPGLSDSPETRLIGSKIYGGLCRFDAAGIPQPDLAESWEVSADGLTYVFHMRPGVIWHDSGAVTANDVAFSIGVFHRVLQPRLGLDRVRAVRVPDANTVVVTLAAPFGSFLRQMDATFLPIVPQHVHDCPGFALDPRQVPPVGTGPFWMANWLRLKRFEWFTGPKPALAEIACPIMPDAAARLALLDQPGALLVGAATEGTDLAALQQRPGLAVDAEPANVIAGLQLNQSARPLDDVRVRRGLACAIDRAALLRDVWSNRGRAAAKPASAMAAPLYDPRAAAAYFTEASLRPDDDGIRARLPHLVPQREPWQQLASRLRAMLSHVGIDLIPEMVSEAEWTRRAAAGDYVTTGFLARQTGDAMLDLTATLSGAPPAGEATRVWLAEPAVSVVRDVRLQLPGGVFGTFANAAFSSGLDAATP